MNTVTDFGVKILVIAVILTLLPASPLTGFSYLVTNLPYLSFVNWFLPITEMIVILETWLLVVSVYYTLLFLINYTGIVKS